MSATSPFAPLTGRFVHSPRSRPGPFTAAAHPRPARGVRQSETGTRIRVIFAAGSGHRERDQPRDHPRSRHPRRGPARARVRPRRARRRHVCPDRGPARTLLAWARPVAHRPGGVRSPPHARPPDERTANIVAGRPRRGRRACPLVAQGATEHVVHLPGIGLTHVRQKPPTCRDVRPCAPISPPVGPWPTRRHAFDRNSRT